MGYLKYYCQLSFLKAGLFYCDRITSASPTYAQEIQHEALGFSMQGLLYQRRGVLLGSGDKPQPLNKPGATGAVSP